MKVVTTFHHPSSVLSSVKCQLSSRDLEHLVIAKIDRIDVYSLQPHGLQHECGLEIWGKVVSVKAVPILGSSRSNLLLFLAHPDPELIFLSYSESESGARELTTRKQLQLYERTPRPAEFLNDVLIHPSGKIAVVSCYTGKLKIVKFKAGNYQEDFDVTLPELNVFSLAFLPVPEDEFAIAILYMDYQERVQLIARDVLIDDFELSHHPSTVLHPTPISAKVLPCPTECIPELLSVPPSQLTVDGDDDDESEGFFGGVLIVGGKQILLFELANKQGQERQRGKRRRLEAKKKSTDAAEVEKAQAKEMEREGRKRKPRGSVEWPWSEVTACCVVSSHSFRYFIGDSFGRLSMLSLDHLKEEGLILIPLGETSPPTTLTYLTTQTLFLGSHLGDSQLLQINPTPTFSLSSPTLATPPEVKLTPAGRLGVSNTGKGKGRALDDNNDFTKDPAKGCVIESYGSFVSVLHTFKNIAPIMDAALVDIDGSGERQVVTCSGGGNTGSVNVVRNGANFTELASIPGLTDVTNIWPVRNQFEDSTDSRILVSTLQSTHLFEINDGGNSTSLYCIKGALTGLVFDSPTLAFGNIARRITDANGKSSYANSQLVVQVTPRGAFLLEYDVVMGTYVQHSRWEERGREVVAASVNPSQVVLALNGGRLVALNITQENVFNVVAQNKGNFTEISTVSCTPQDSSKYFSNYVTVSYWGENEIEVLTFDKQGFVLVSKSPPLPALVRSAILYNFGSDTSPKGADYHPHVLAGLGDGSVVYFAWKDKQFKEKKIISLGRAPVSLTVCQVDGKRAVFAAGNRATVLSWEKKRLHTSPIMLKEIVGVSPLNTSIFKSSLVLGTPTGLFIGRVKDLDKMHIRSVSLGLDNPRRLVYQPNLKVFGVACTRTVPGRIGGLESSTSSFKLLDDTTFSDLSTFNCETDEEITALTTLSPLVGDKTMPLFCLGTFTYEPDEKEPTNGRLLIFTAFQSASSLQLSLIASADVKGCVYSLALINDTIVAAVNSSVMLYGLKVSDDVPSPSFTLQLLSEWNHNYYLTSLATYGDHIVAGDQISSVSILKVSDSKIRNVAKDYGPLWPVAVEASDEANIIGANDALNLFTFILTRTMGRASLERNGSYHLADFVTKFIRGSLASSDSSSNTALEAKHVFFTSSGRIGVIVDVVGEQLSLHLTSLQRNLAAVIQGVGGVTHTRFRAPHNTRGRSDADVASFGFLDGDFIEQFLTYMGTPGRLEKIIGGHSDPEKLTMPIEEIQLVLENLQGMH